MIRVLIAVFLLFAMVLPLVAEKSVNDGVLMDRIRQRLVSDPEVKGYAVEVSVKDGVVTLDGTVASDRAKSRAEKLTRKEKGVKNVVNNLRVEIASPKR